MTTFSTLMRYDDLTRLDQAQLYNKNNGIANTGYGSTMIL